MSVMAPPAPSLPPLRESLQLHPAPRSGDGAPAWTLHDPARNRFFRIGWLEFEILARWGRGGADAVAAAVTGETTLHPTAAEVESLKAFLAANNLLESRTRADRERLEGQARRRPPFWSSLLFYRRALVNPDPFLARCLPWVSWLFSGWYAVTLLALALPGLWLAGRQWDALQSAFPHFFTPTGLLWFAGALFVAKAAHELGHAFALKAQGLRVPTMGVVFMFFWPLLYTDAGESWKRVSRRERLRIALAGAAAEALVAAAALLIWNFLPDGPARSAALALAGTSLAMSLAVNLNPLMRFDGYYLLTDLLEIPNLQSRAYALAKWRLRRLFLGWRAPCPERLPGGRRLFLEGWAFAAWGWRTALYAGIALGIYAFVFKLLGVILLAAMFFTMVVRPALLELGQWGRIATSGGGAKGSLLATLLILAGVTAFLLMPRPVAVEFTGLLGAAAQAEVVAPRAGRLEKVLIRPGETAAKGQPLFILEDDVLTFEQDRAALEASRLGAEIKAMEGNASLMGEQAVLAQRRAEALGRVEGLERTRAALTVAAPVAGIITDAADGLHPGRLVAVGERLVQITGLGNLRVEGWLPEADLQAVAVGAAARFYPENGSLDPFDLTLVAIDPAARRTLDEPAAASPHGGDTPARLLPDGGLETVKPVYRALLEPKVPLESLPRMVRGQVILQGRSISFLAQALRRVQGVLVRESGF